MLEKRNLLKDLQYRKFCAYGFLKNLKFFEAFLILFLRDKGLSFTAIGSLYAIQEITTNVLEVPSGITADVFGRKKALAGSFLAYILSFCLLFFSENFGLFLAAFFFFGVGEAFRSGTHKGMIKEYLSQKGMKNLMADYYSRTRAWSQFGLALSSLLAGGIVFYSGSYDPVFLFSIIPYLVNFFLILSYPDYIDKSGDEGLGFSTRERIKQMVQQFLPVLKSPKNLRLIHSSAMHTAYLKAMKDYIQPMMVTMILALPFFSGRSIEERTALLVGGLYFFIFLITSASSAHSSLLSVVFSSRLSERTLLTGLAAGALSGLLYLFGFSIGAVAFFILIYVMENLRKPIMTGFVADAVDNNILSSVLSFQSQWKTVLTAILALLCGGLADLWGIGRALAVLSGILIVLTFLIDKISAGQEKH
jgi:MFS family permease